MQELVKAVSKNWWVLLIRGLASIAIGVMAFAWPGPTLASLIFVWGIYAFIDGFIALFGGISDRFWASLLIGLSGIVAGLCAFFYPGITALVMLYFVAAWAIVRGILEIVAAIRLRKVIVGEWLLGIAGAISVLFGFALLYNPIVGMLAVLWMVGAYAILFGILLVGLAFRLKSHASRPPAAMTV